MEGLRGVDERSGGVEVRRQVAGRHRARGGDALERAGDSRVKTHAPSARQLGDNRLAYDCVREREPIRGSGGPHEPRRFGGLQRVQRLVEFDADRAGKDVGVELRAGDGRDRQRVGSPLGQPGKPPAHNVAHPPGERCIGIMTVVERADHLADEERVARGGPPHAAGM
jgi:hypothetical protein